MAKKTKGRQPNAPELQEILLASPTIQQPPHNPYYQDMRERDHEYFSSTVRNYGPSANPLPPPPYSDLSQSAATVMQPKVNLHRGASSNYARLQNHLTSGDAANTVISVQQQPTALYDRIAERHHRRVRKFNNEMIIAALVSIVVSFYAHSLYSERHCINYTVHQPNKDFIVRLNDVRDAQLTIAYGSVIVLLVCMIKCGTGQSKSYSCYIFLIALMTFFGTLCTGYLAYLAYWSPCSLKLSEVISNAGKSILGLIADQLPSPDKRLLNESNVFQLAQDDKAGVMIFFLDLSNFIVWLSAFISAILLC